MITITEGMLSSGQPIAQGEVLIWSKRHAPASVLNGMVNLKLSEMTMQDGQIILGHSETGHHHVLEPVNKAVSISKAAIVLVDAANDSFVELRLYEDCALVHLRQHDTHDSIVLPPGEYIRGIREEQTPEGWRRVAD